MDDVVRGALVFLRGGVVREEEGVACGFSRKGRCASGGITGIVGFVSVLWAISEYYIFSVGDRKLISVRNTLIIEVSFGVNNCNDRFR